MSALTFIKIGRIGIYQFFVLTILAMIVFPGGTIHNPDVANYSFFNNFFSDLGRTEDFSGNVNPSRWIFTITLTLVGGSVISFIMAIPVIFKHDKRFNKLSYSAVFFGVVAAISYIGIAFTPWDKYLLGHEISVKVGFIAFLLMSTLMTYMIYKSSYYPNFYGHVYVLFNFILLGYILLLFLGPDATLSSTAMVIQVVCQKIVVYAQIICTLIQMNGAISILKLEPNHNG